MLHYSNSKAYKKAYNWSHPRRLRLAVRLHTARTPTEAGDYCSRVRLGESYLLFLATEYDTRNSGVPTKFQQFCLQQIMLCLCVFPFSKIFYKRPIQPKHGKTCLLQASFLPYVIKTSHITSFKALSEM